jgi:hypothetical protein
MEVRLVQLLASFIHTGTEYSLARLEFAMAHPELPAPPTIGRPPDASEATLREIWPQLERQLEQARAYAKQFASGASKQQKEDSTAAWLRRIVQELDQYARAIRWVLTVTETE